MRKIILVGALFATCSSIAGPLGVSKGMTLEELKKQGTFVAGNQNFIYVAKTIINGHPAFETYTVALTPEQGLCKIQGMGKVIKTSSFGTELEGRYKDLVDVISVKYGSPSSNFDFLRAGSLWKEPQHWMMGLLKKERTLSAFWRPSENNNFPDAIQSIKIETLPISQNEGYITVSYEFDNFNACIAVIQAKKNSNL